MSCDTIKYKVFQDPLTQKVRLELYRPYGINDEWAKIDSFSDLTVSELRCLAEYLIYIFNKGKSK